MKNTVLTGLFMLLSCFAAFGQSQTDKAEIEQVVTAFSSNADNQDATQMASLLDENYRAVVNRLFGSEKVSLMDKTTYLQLLEEKKIGGDKRKVSIEHVDITNNNAIVKASFEGKELNFTTYLLLVKTVENEWLIVSDMPYIDKAKM